VTRVASKRLSSISSTGVGKFSRRRSVCLGALLMLMLAGHVVTMRGAAPASAAKPPAATATAFPTATATGIADAGGTPTSDVSLDAAASSPTPADPGGASILVAPTVAAGAPTARIDAATLGAAPFSLDEQVVAGTLAFTILAAAGPPPTWTVTVVSTDLVAAGPGVRVIPADHVAVTAVGAPVASAGTTAGVTVPASATGGIGAPRVVLVSDGLRRLSDISLALTLAVTVPPGTVAGDYQGVITVTVAVGP